MTIRLFLKDLKVGHFTKRVKISLDWPFADFNFGDLVNDHNGEFRHFGSLEFSH